MTTLDEFQAILDSPEGSHIEFKTASGGFHFDELVKHCVALANEGGGMIVLGDQVRTLIRELKRDGRIDVRGATKAARWFPAGPKPNSTQ